MPEEATCTWCGLDVPLDENAIHEDGMLCMSCAEVCACIEVRL